MADIKIGRIPMGMYLTNCYFLYKEGSGDCIVIDPADSGQYLYDKLTEKGFNIKAILLTHGHFDHIYGVKKLSEAAECKVYAYTDEAKLLEDVKLNCSLSTGRGVSVIPDELFTDGEEVTLADMTFSVIHTPGHTQGSCCYYFKEPGFLIAGDTLFAQSVGRTDLPTGSAKTLIDSINTRLMGLPDDVKVYPGHGDSTTIGFERENNPFL